MVKVYAKNEQLAKVLKHPLSKVGFTSADAAANWPDDSFTHRRIRDGDVTTDAPTKKHDRHHHRSHEPHEPDAA